MVNKNIKDKHKRLDLKIGFICNNYCLHCVQGNKRGTFGNKSFKQLKKELAQGKKNCGEVVFTGGEPTIHKDFLKLVGYAKKIGFKNIQIQSNGRMFAYKKFCVEAIKAGSSDFAIAVIGHTGKIHDYVTSIKGSFQQTVSGILNLKSLGARVATNTVISKVNYRYLPEIAKKLVEIGVDQFQFAFPHPAGKARENFEIIVPRIKKIMPFVKKGLLIGAGKGKKVMTEAIPYCFMEDEFEQYVAERIIPESEVFDADYRVDNYKEYRITEAKAKGPLCKSCRYDASCEGPWREYPEFFGWEEFKPLIK